MTTLDSEKIALRIFGGDLDHMADAVTLAHVLIGLQRAVHIVAMDNARIPVTKSQYIPKAIQDAFPILCEIPEAGSYRVPAIVGHPDDLGAPQHAHVIMDTLRECLQGLVKDDVEPFKNILRDGRYKTRLLDAFRTMLPKPGAAWKLDLSSPGRESITLSGDVYGRISVFKDRLREQSFMPSTITGSLQAMDFTARKVTILYPETNQVLECYYEDEVELELVDSRREYVQVTGTVLLDRETGYPTGIQGVENIQALDLSDFEIREFSCREEILEFKKPLVLSPGQTESKQFLTLRQDDIGIDVIAQTREQLLDELKEQLAMLWIEFGLEDDAQLTRSALQLKRQLLGRITVKEGVR